MVHDWAFMKSVYSNSKLAKPVCTSGSPILQHQDHGRILLTASTCSNVIHFARSTRTSLEEGISLADGVVKKSRRVMTQCMILQAKLSVTWQKKLVSQN